MVVKSPFVAVALSVGSLLVVPVAMAQEPASNTHESGVRVYVDPETGRLVSAPVTAEQRAAAAADAATFSQDSSKVVEAVAADGSPMYILNGQFELALGVAVDEHGQRHYGCSDASHAALSAAEHASEHAASPAANDR